MELIRPVGEEGEGNEELETHQVRRGRRERSEELEIHRSEKEKGARNSSFISTMERK